MQDKLTYRGEKILERSGFAAENNADYIQSYLDSQIELFNRIFEDIERRSYDPRENPDMLLNATTRAIIDLSYVCEEFEQQLAHDKAAITHAQVEFREKTNKYFLKSHFMNRARMWPQGYPGDYKTLEDTYRNSPMSSGIGYYLDRHFLATALGVAVRERLSTLAGLLQKELARRSRPRVLNIACGSCRELVEVAPEVKQSGAMLTCIDFDTDALSFAANRMAYTGIAQEQMLFRKYNALRMINHERNLKEFGMQDIIYSTGFFDYVEDEVLVRLLSSAYQLLNPGGVLIASFKDCRRYRTQEYHWFVDWHGFLQRTEDDMRLLLERAEIPRKALKDLRVKSGVITFFVATK
jgi:extracellular factor (EF) 3-hydroxypalmitic acid methyl ester biosynthesis protein